MKALVVLVGFLALIGVLMWAGMTSFEKCDPTVAGDCR